MSKPNKPKRIKQFYSQRSTIITDTLEKVYPDLYPPKEKRWPRKEADKAQSDK